MLQVRVHLALQTTVGELASSCPRPDDRNDAVNDDANDSEGVKIDTDTVLDIYIGLAHDAVAGNEADNDGDDTEGYHAHNDNGSEYGNDNVNDDDDDHDITIRTIMMIMMTLMMVTTLVMMVISLIMTVLLA